MKEKIKQILSCAMLSAALLLAGCNSEETPFDDNGGIPVEKGKLSFVLPMGANRTVTYATVNGKDAEYQIHNLRIFWFTVDPQDGVEKVYKRFGWGDGTAFSGIDVPGAGENEDPLDLKYGENTTWATISVGDITDASKFYIVANVGGTNMITSSALSSVQAGVTTLDQFKGLLSDALNASGGDLKLLTTPLPMSVSKSTSSNVDDDGFIEVGNPFTQQQVQDIHLKRRVARFDIMNTADYSFFEITNVVVSKAQSKVWLMDSVFSVADSYAGLTGGFVVPATAQADDANAFNGPTGSGNDANNNGTDDDFELGGTQYAEREHLTKAAFYLYPTLLAQDGTKTEIVLEGLYKGIYQRFYKLDLTADVPIEANKVYTIRVLRVEENNVKLQLTVDHWDDVDTLLTVNPGKTVSDWGTLASSAQSTVSQSVASAETDAFELEFSASPARPDTITFTTVGTNVQLSANPKEQHVTLISFDAKPGLTAGVDYLQSDLAAVQAAEVISSTETKTYGAHYVTEHKVVLPATNAPIQYVMNVFSSTDPNSIKKVNMFSNNYAKLGYKPVVIDTLIWAPVNVGATLLPDTKSTFTASARGDSITGPLFQWGRNMPMFWSSKTIKTTATQFTSVADALADTSFVTGTNWLNVMDDDLWGGVSRDPAKMQGPCPEGWRLPTLQECQDMMGNGSNGLTTRTTSAASGWVAFQRKAAPATNNLLYFPVAGNRPNTNGSLTGYGGTTGIVDMWCADVLVAGANAARVYINNTNVISYTGGDPRAYGETIRAVRTVPNYQTQP